MAMIRVGVSTQGTKDSQVFICEARRKQDAAAEPGLLTLVPLL